MIPTLGSRGCPLGYAGTLENALSHQRTNFPPITEVITRARAFRQNSACDGKGYSCAPKLASSRAPAGLPLPRNSSKEFYKLSLGLYNHGIRSSFTPGRKAPLKKINKLEIECVFLGTNLCEEFLMVEL